jgi:hypothetical protein
MEVFPRFSAFLLSCVGSGLVTGLITLSRSPTNCLQDPYFQITFDGKQAKGSITKCEKNKKKKKKFGNIHRTPHVTSSLWTLLDVSWL